MLAHVISMIIIAVSLRYDARMTELKRVRLNPLKKRHMWEVREVRDAGRWYNCSRT